MALVSGAWSDDDLAKLLEGFDNGVPIGLLALALRRTGSSVANKLVQQRRLAWIDGHYIKPWATGAEITRVDVLAKREL